MPVVEPLAVLAAIAALVAVGTWARVVRVISAGDGSWPRSGAALSLAAVATAITLALAATSILAPALALLFL